MNETTTCPLITDYTRELGIPDKLLEKLYLVRKFDPEIGPPLGLDCGSLLRTHKRSNGDPIVLREFQKQMVFHLTRMPRFICGDAVGLGKTLDAIASACWLKLKRPNIKFIVLTTKSTTGQWRSEIEDFSELRPFVMVDKYKGKHSYAARIQQVEDFLKGDKKDVLICKYTSLLGKRRKFDNQFDEGGNTLDRDGREKISPEIKLLYKTIKEHKENVVLILDECHKFKGTRSQTRRLVSYLNFAAGRIWALSATAIKNNLEEFYSIASAIGIRPFGWMKDFREEHCIYQPVHVGHGRYKEQLIGYSKPREFKIGIRPFFLGRSQKQVKEPLPRLTTVYHPIDLDDVQARLLLQDIPTGAFQLPPSIKRVAGEWRIRERSADNMMTMLSVYQLVANHPALLDPSNVKAFQTRSLSPKEETLLDMLDGDFRGEKVIVFTKYRTWIDRLDHLTNSGFYTSRRFLRITGAESEKKRDVNKQLFQNDPDYDLIVINSAAMEGVNLQQAAHMVLLDVPWSWGDLIQLVGRMVRMASPHTACTLHIFAAKGTIDEYAIDTLKGKKGVFEKILGDSHSSGILDDKDFFDLDSGMEDCGTDEEFEAMLRAHVKETSMASFLRGELLSEAQTDEQYTPIYEQSPEKKRKRKGPSDEELWERWNK